MNCTLITTAQRPEQCSIPPPSIQLASTYSSVDVSALHWSSSPSRPGCEGQLLRTKRNRERLEVVAMTPLNMSRSLFMNHHPVRKPDRGCRLQLVTGELWPPAFRNLSTLQRQLSYEKRLSSRLADHCNLKMQSDGAHGRDRRCLLR